MAGDKAGPGAALQSRMRSRMRSPVPSSARTGTGIPRLLSRSRSPLRSNKQRKKVVSGTGMRLTRMCVDDGGSKQARRPSCKFKTNMGLSACRTQLRKHGGHHRAAGENVLGEADSVHETAPHLPPRSKYRSAWSSPQRSARNRKFASPPQRTSCWRRGLWPLARLAE